MRIFNNPLSWSNTALTADRTTTAEWLGHIMAYSITVVVSGGTAPTGTFYVQASNDDTERAADVSNWVSLEDIEIAITDNGTYMWNIDGAGYKWVRVFYDFTSGTGTVSGRINGKGV